MSLIQDVTNGVRHRRTENPRTILAFYATVLGLVLAAIVGAVVALASTRIYVEAIPWLLVFGGALALLMLVGVFVVAHRDPSKLMLGQVTGTEYVEIQRLTVASNQSAGDVLPVALKQAQQRILRGDGE